MFVKNKNIDNGKKFDWGRTSENYAKYRDIYPEEFYEKIIKHGLCVKGQYVLDIGTGTGVLPRNMYQYGAKWTGIDISEEQIKQRESWNGRLKACRGIGASLTDDEIHSWENEHLKLLSEIAPKEFDILHYVAIAELKVKK